MSGFPSQLLVFFGWTVAKATVLTIAAALVVLLMRRSAAAWRHTVWTLLVGALLLLPALELLGPRWSVPLPAPRPRAQAAAVVPLLAPFPIDFAAASHAEIPASVSAPPAPHPQRGPEPVLWVLVAWLAGAVLLLGRIGLGLLGLRRLELRARAAGDDVVRDLTQAAGRVRVLVAGDVVSTPMTWGTARPVLLLPASVRDWPAERTRLVLMHELTHVARRDWLWQLAAQVACALYWFHPLVWWAADRLRTEGERACDEAVLAAGAEASAYAECLLEVLRMMKQENSGRPALAMAHGSRIEERIRGILSGTPRRRATTAGIAVCGVVGLGLLVPLAGVRAEQKKPKEKPAAESSVSIGVTDRIDDAAPTPTPAPPASRTASSYWAPSSSEVARLKRLLALAEQKIAILRDEQQPSAELKSQLKSAQKEREALVRELDRVSTRQLPESARGSEKEALRRALEELDQSRRRQAELERELADLRRRLDGRNDFRRGPGAANPFAPDSNFRPTPEAANPFLNDFRARALDELKVGEARLQQGQAQLDRALKLQAQGAITEADVAKAKADLEQARANLAVAKRRLEEDLVRQKPAPRPHSEGARDLDGEREEIKARVSSLERQRELYLTKLKQIQARVEAGAATQEELLTAKLELEKLDFELKTAQLRLNRLFQKPRAVPPTPVEPMPQRGF